MKIYTDDHFERATDTPWTVVLDPPVILRVLRCGLFPLHGVPGGPHRADVGDLIHVAADAAAALVNAGECEAYE